MDCDSESLADRALGVPTVALVLRGLLPIQLAAEPDRPVAITPGWHSGGQRIQASALRGRTSVAGHHLPTANRRDRFRPFGGPQRAGLASSVGPAGDASTPGVGR